MGALRVFFMKLPYCFFLLLILFGSCRSDSATEAAANPGDTLSGYLYKLPDLTNWDAKAPANETLLEEAISDLHLMAVEQIAVIQEGKMVVFDQVTDSLICTLSVNPLIEASLIILGNNESILAEENSIDLLFDKQNSTEKFNRLDRLCQHNWQLPLRQAAELKIFEPAALDQYKWNEQEFCTPLQGYAHLAKIWTDLGRAGRKVILPHKAFEDFWKQAYVIKAQQSELYGWQLSQVNVKGRKQAVLFWKQDAIFCCFLPEMRAMVLITGEHLEVAQLWPVVASKLAPALTL